MVELVGYRDLPNNIKQQIYKVIDIWKNYIGNDLVGIYLHGSIALGAFYPESGDIDILVVVKESLDKPTKMELAKQIIKIDGRPCPFEISAIVENEAKEWKTPGNCVFHYSDMWTEKYQEKLLNPKTECYVVDNEFPDADVTSYIKLIKQSGIVLYGRKIETVFGNISNKDFWEAIIADIDDYNFHDYASRYLASNILILGRILSFKIQKKILSKYEAGHWMINYVPEELRYIPQQAMEIWFGGEQYKFPEADLEKLRLFLITEIKN